MSEKKVADGERRFGLIEVRARQDGEADKRKLGGYAARFNSPATIGGYFIEQIAPGAFTNAINTQDVRALFNHDENFVLGRTSSKTLSLREDSAGLVWECDPPDTSWATDLKVSVDRGDISQCSFQFRAVVQEWDYSGDLPVRMLKQVDLYDVSAVTFPAYDDTTVALRSLAAAGVIPPLSDAEKSRLAGRRSLLDRLSIRAA